MTYTITDVTSSGNQTTVTTTISGDFPGSPFAGLTYRVQPS